MHKSALCCLFITPTLIIPQTNLVENQVKQSSPVIESVHTKNTNPNTSEKEFFHAFGELAALCYRVVESNASEEAVIAAKSIQDFYTMAQDQYGIEPTVDAQVFASAAEVLPAEEKAALLGEIRTFCKAQNSDAIQTILQTI